MFGLCSAASPCQAGDGAQPGAASAPCACSGSCPRAKLTPCEHPLSRAWGRAPSPATLLGEGWLPQELLLHPSQISPAVTGASPAHPELHMSVPSCTQTLQLLCLLFETHSVLREHQTEIHTGNVVCVVTPSQRGEEHKGTGHLSFLWITEITHNARVTRPPL